MELKDAAVTSKEKHSFQKSWGRNPMKILRCLLDALRWKIEFNGGLH